MNNSVYVIIVAQNHLSDTNETIECFLQQDYKNLHIIVCDNASDEGTTEQITRSFPEVEILKNKENLGWATANNIGIKSATEKGAEFVLLSNNDIAFDNPHLISELVLNYFSLSENYKIGVLGTEQYSYYDRNLLLSNGILYFCNSKKINNKFNPFRNNYKPNLPKSFRKTDSVIGSFMLINIETFNKIGFFDENYFFTWEDTDFCYRAWQENYLIVVNENLKIYHKVSATCKTKSAFLTYYLIRNQFSFLKKHKRVIPNYSMYIFLYYYKFLRKIAGIILFPTRLSDAQGLVFKAAIHGFTDGVFYHRMGKRY
jgi:GT2 family glycosyltransferase